jgi:hypothetical protein
MHYVPVTEGVLGIADGTKGGFSVNPR